MTGRMKVLISKALSHISCDKDILRKHFSVMGNLAGSDKEAEKYIRDLNRKYLITAIIIIVLAAISLTISAKESSIITEISRSDIAGEEKRVNLEVEAEYGGKTVKGPVQLDISARKLSEDECREVLIECSEDLGDIFDVSEEGLYYADKDIHLPLSDEVYGIDIAWSSSDPVLMSDEGRINVTGLANESETVTLSAELSMGGVSITKDFEIMIYDSPEAYEGSLNRTVREVVSDLEENREGDIIFLPEENADGVRFTWREKSEGYAGAVLLVGIFVMLFLYITRYRGAERMAKKYRSDVCSEFPAVPERMLLLIDGGMTAYNAMIRISKDFGKHSGYRKSPLAAEIEEIGKRVDLYNANLIQEWKELSARMQSGDMLRFCSIIEDNITKGSDLYSKLQLECKNLRESRKKLVQEKIRLMDSKMMIPMMLMLFSLIIVAAGPAVMEF